MEGYWAERLVAKSVERLADLLVGSWAGLKVPV